MLADIPIGRCCSRPRFNAVGGIDESVWPAQLGTALRRKLRSIAAELAGNRDAAARVVCDRSVALDENSCGGPALSCVDACCAADANARQQGKSGCAS